MKIYLPLKSQHLTFSFIMSGFMSLSMSAILTLINLGWTAGLFMKWLYAFIVAWPVAFILIMIFAPFTRYLLMRFFVFR